MLARLRSAPWTLPGALFAAAVVALFVRLGEPGQIIFDETYYVGDARAMLDQGVADGFAVHPPVGKWLIAAGIELFGDGAFGWRAAGAAAGAVIVVLTYLIGLRLFHRRGPAALAGLLVLTDGLLFVQARTSMLDIFLALFVALGAWLLLVDFRRSRLDAQPPRDEEAPSAGADAPEPLPRRGHGVRVLAGVAFGLAIATKWSGVLALGAAGLVLIGWELALRRRWTGRFLAAWRPALGSIALTLVVVPAGVYLLSYTPWLANYTATSEGEGECGEQADGCQVGLPGRLAGLWRHHRSVLDFHTRLQAEHPYRAAAYTWPVMTRPVVYYWETCDPERTNQATTTGDGDADAASEPCVVEEGEAAEVLAVGNPTLWWGFLAAVVPLGAGLGARDRRAWFLAAFWLAQFLPWLVVDRPVFFFYMTPVVPFLALGVTYAVVWLADRRPLVEPATTAGVGAALGFGGGWLVDGGVVEWIGLGVGWVVGAAAGGLLTAFTGRQRPPPSWWTWRRSPALWVGVGVAVLAVAAFVYFYPVWAGLPLDVDTIRQRWWIRPGWI